VLKPLSSKFEEHLKSEPYQWSKSLEVTADGEGIVSHAGLAVLRQLADKTGLTSGLSQALATQRLLIHDRGRPPPTWPARSPTAPR
jgi:hypothetical protein